MPHFNRTILIGHLTRDPDAKQTQSGTQIATFGLGVNERVPDGQGGYREQANFFDITFFGKRAEALLKWFHKGDPILIEAFCTPPSILLASERKASGVVPRSPHRAFACIVRP